MESDSSRQSGDGRVTWVVICTSASGKSFPEYVEGTRLVSDSAVGALKIMDGDRIVREYSAGAWTNFCEWVSAYSEFFSANVFRLPRTDSSVPTQRTMADSTRALVESQRNLAAAPAALAAAVGKGTAEALSAMRDSLTRTQETSEADGAVRPPTRLPGPRHA